MDRFFDLPRVPQFAKTAVKIRTRGMDFLISGVRNILTKEIQRLYYINLREAPWRNNYALNVMLSEGFTLSYTLSPMSLTLVINERVLFPKSLRAESLRKNWKRELYQENAFAERKEIAESDARFFEGVYRQVADFVYKDFVPYVTSLAK